MNKRKLTSEEIEFIVDFVRPNMQIPKETANSIVELTKKRIKKQLETQEVYPEVISDLKKEIERNYIQSIIDPGTSVGILCAQSIGERQTQNSLFFHSSIVLKKAGKIVKTTIGEFIENEMKNGDNVFCYDDDNYIKHVSDIEVLTVSQNEKIEWKNVNELSKHPTNGDLVKIKTKSGREVTTTLSHSHLKKSEDSIIPVLGSELKLGDRIPVIKQISNNNNDSDVDSILVSDYIDGDMDKIELIGDYVYINKTKLKNKIKLDKNFGWFMGAYLSDTNLCTEYSTLIINSNPEFEENIRQFCSIHELEFKTTKEYGENPGMKKITHHIHSPVLSMLITKLCGVGSDKTLPSFVYETDTKFISSIIKGYMDGNSDIFKGKIRCRSVCKNLLDELGLLFNYVGIFVKLDSSNGINHLLIEGDEYIKKYIREIGTDLFYKKEALNNLIGCVMSSYVEVIPNDIKRHIIRLSSMLNVKMDGLHKNIGRYELGKFIKECKSQSILKRKNIDEPLKYCEMSYNSDIVWDEIVEIEIIKECDYNYKYVYDFSVNGNETFALMSGIVVHNTLNTFHRAGQGDKTVTTGVPRFQELLNATKNPKMVNCNIYFNERCETIQELREIVGHNLVCLKLQDLSENIEIKMNKEEEPWYEIFKILYNDNFTKHTDCISITLKKNILFKHRINVQEIANRIEKEWEDLHCVFSCNEIARIDIFIDMEKIKFTESQLLFVTEENAHEIYIDECVLPILEKLVFFGIPDIKNIYYTRDSNTDEWYIETDGSNFRQLLALPIVDMSRLHSNNVWDIYYNLGIEAAREFLVNEFESIMIGINSCHVKLLVEKMTFNGNISSISRYTLRKDECGPLSKASFEESVEHMVKSGFAGEIEKCIGVSASIICGNRAKMGTGMVDLKININQLKNAIPVFRDPKNDGTVIEKMGKMKLT